MVSLKLTQLLYINSLLKLNFEQLCYSFCSKHSLLKTIKTFQDFNLMDYSFKKLILVLLVLISYKVQAEPTLHKLIFEFNSRMSVQEEFLIFDGSAVSDPLYSSNELRIQLNGGKTYEAIEFYDKVYTTHGQAAAYNILDFRLIKFKGKLLYFQFLKLIN